MSRRQWADEERLEAWAALLRVHAAVVAAVDADLAGRGHLPLGEYDILFALSRAPRGRYRMQELSEHVVLSRSRVSRIVDDLERRGLVARMPDETDRRASLAMLTAEGRHAFRRGAPAYLRSIERHFSAHLTPGEHRQLAAILGKVLRSHERAGTRP